MAWTHTLTSTAGLVLIAFKLRALEPGRLREGTERRHALTSGYDKTLRLWKLRK